MVNATGKTMNNALKSIYICKVRIVDIREKRCSHLPGKFQIYAFISSCPFTETRDANKLTCSQPIAPANSPDKSLSNNVMCELYQSNRIESINVIVVLFSVEDVSRNNPSSGLQSTEARGAGTEAHGRDRRLRLQFGYA